VRSRQRPAGESRRAPIPWIEVPTISRFHGVAIRIYPEDHGYPHFHVWAAGREAKIRINPVEVIEDGLTRKQMRMVKAWAALHQPELEENLATRDERCNSGSNRAMGVIRANYEIVAVEVVRFGVLALTFADGLEGEVALDGHLRGPVFDRARTPAGFAEVFVDEEGGTIAWPGDADLAPDTLYFRVKSGEWPADLNRSAPEH
jgi:hypothetical protein